MDSVRGMHVAEPFAFPKERPINIIKTGKIHQVAFPVFKLDRVQSLHY